MKIKKKESYREQFLRIEYGETIQIQKESDSQLEVLRHVASRINKNKIGSVYTHGYFKISCPKNDLIGSDGKHKPRVIYITHLHSKK
jgi:hypothetical protein